MCGGIDGDGADTANDGTFIEAVAADDSAIDFRHDAIEIGAGKHHGKQAGGGFGSREVAGKAVGRVDGGEGVVANLPAGRGVLRHGYPNHYFRLCFRRHEFPNPLV